MIQTYVSFTIGFPVKKLICLDWIDLGQVSIHDEKGEVAILA